MRIILNFIFFGLLFYALHLYLPQVFDTLVSWAAAIFDFLHGLFAQVRDAAHTTPSPPPVQ